ncbi:MAG: kinase [Armatimonadetes bacterium]|nr:kinase [Armatimonadota bacterium]
MSYVIGVDAGGSKSFCLAADMDGTIVGFGKAGPGSYEVVGLQTAKVNILKCVERALRQGGPEKSDVRHGVFALAGADFYPEDFEMLTEAMEDLHVARECTVKNDSIAGLRAGVTRPYGVCVIMGSGFNGAGIGLDGREVRYISEGFLYGDVGGGHTIAREVLHHAYRSWDGRGRKTVLEQKVLEFFGYEDLYELARYLYYNREPHQRIPGLCPICFEAAFDGDEVARELIVRFGREAGVSANALIRKLDLCEEELEVVLAGSVFKGKGPLLIETVKQTILPVAPKARVITPRYEPVVGALLLALDAAGVEITGQIEARLDATLPAECLRERPPSAA